MPTDLLPSVPPPVPILLHLRIALDTADASRLIELANETDLLAAVLAEVDAVPIDPAAVVIEADNWLAELCMPSVLTVDVVVLLRPAPVPLVVPPPPVVVVVPPVVSLSFIVLMTFDNIFSIPPPL